MKGLKDVSNDDVGLLLARILIKKGIVKESDLTLENAVSDTPL